MSELVKQQLIERKPRVIQYTSECNPELVRKVLSMPDSFWVSFKKIRQSQKDKEDEVDKNYKENVKVYKTLIDDKGFHTFKEKVKPLGYGRGYTDCKQSLITLPRVLANYFVDGKYKDIDIVNCHPTLMSQLIHFFNESGELANVCPELDAYVANRAAVLKDNQMYKEDFMKVMYSDKYQGPQFMNNINKFLTCDLYNVFAAKYPKMVEKIIKNKKKKNANEAKKEDYNLRGAVLSMIMQTYEREIAYVMDDYFESKRIYKRFMIYDGFNVDTEFNAVDELCEYVKEMTGFPIKLAFKDMRDKEFDNLMKEYERVPIREEPDYYEEDEIAEQIVDENEEFIKVVNSNYDIWIKNRNTSLWSPLSPKMTEFNVLFQECDCCLRVGKTTKVVKSYTKIWPNLCKQIEAYIHRTFKIDSEFFKMLDNYVDYLPFPNCVWSFKKSKFLDKLPDNIYCSKRLNTEFDVSIDYSAESIYIKNLFEDMFDNKTEMNEVFKFFARALAGNVQDKLWTKITSIRDSGKSLTIEYFRQCFTEFVGFIDYKDIILKADSFIPTDRMNEFKGNFVENRLVFVSEMKADAKLDGNIIKQVASGGDFVPNYRAAYGRAKSGNMKGSLCIMAQSVPMCEPIDANQNSLTFEMPCTYVDESLFNNPEVSYGSFKKKLKNAALSKLMNNPKMKMAFIMFVFSFYSEKPEYPLLKANTIEEMASCELSSNPFELFKQVLYSYFTKSTVQSDCVKSKDVLTKIQSQINTMNFKRLKTFMLDEGFGYDNNKQGSFYTFIKIKTENPNEDCFF
jgi:hypothetical protein